MFGGIVVVTLSGFMPLQGYPELVRVQEQPGLGAVRSHYSPRLLLTLHSIVFRSEAPWIGINIPRSFRGIIIPEA